MGCGCGGGDNSPGQYYLVTKSDGERVLATSRPMASAVLTVYGGSFEQISPGEAVQLIAEGVPSL